MQAPAEKVQSLKAWPLTGGLASPQRHLIQRRPNSTTLLCNAARLIRSCRRLGEDGSAIAFPALDSSPPSPQEGFCLRYNSAVTSRGADGDIAAIGL